MRDPLKQTFSEEALQQLEELTRAVASQWDMEMKPVWGRHLVLRTTGPGPSHALGESASAGRLPTRGRCADVTMEPPGSSLRHPDE